MIIFIIVAFLLGAAAGATVLWRILPARLRQHVDYRQRWEDAVSLLGTQGQLTKKQVDQLTGGSPVPVPVKAQQQPATTAALQALHSMASWDRKSLEVTRAKNGLAPFDDLAGMASWDKKLVLEARAKAEARRIPGEK